MKRKAFTTGFLLWLFTIVFTTHSAAQVIQWSTYLNTAGDDQLLGMTKDNNGDIYILGFTNTNGFPVTPGAIQTSVTPNTYKTTITKLSGATGSLIWSTYLGGDGQRDNISVAWFEWDAVSNTLVLAASVASNNYPLVNGTRPASGTPAFAVLTQIDPATGGIIYSTSAFSGNLPVWGISSVINNTNVILNRAVFKIFYTKGYMYYLYLDSTHKNIVLSKFNLAARQLVFEKTITVSNGTIHPSFSLSVIAGYYLGLVADNNDIFICGTTNANDYPTTTGCYQPVYPAGGTEAYFITRLNAAGDIAFSTFANYNPKLNIVPFPQIAVTSNEVAFYNSVGEGIPVSPGGFNFNNAAVANNGLLKLNRANGALNYFSYLGGPLMTQVYPSQIQSTASGDLIITGNSSSPYLPITPNAIQPFMSYNRPNGYEAPDCYFMHFTRQNQLQYCTYLGGDGFDGTGGAAIDGDNVYISMITSSNDFPVTGNATQLVNKGTKGAPANFVVIAGEYALVKYNIPSAKITYSGFLGTNVNDAVTGGLFEGDNAYLTLKATHYSGKALLNDFPVTGDAFQKTMTGQNNTNGIADHQYLAKINTVTGKLLYGSYIGSLPVSKGEFNRGFVKDKDDIYLAGQSRANDYPVTQGAVRTTYLDSSDLYVTKLSLCYNDIVNDSIHPVNIAVCANSIVPTITGTVPEVRNPSIILRNNIVQPVSGLSNFIYQWQQSNNGTTWNNIAGATGKDFQPSPLSSTRYFRRIAFAPSCENFDTSNITIVTTNGLQAVRPDAGGNNGNYFACPSNNLSLGTNAIPGFTYSWQPSTYLLNADSAKAVFNSLNAGAYVYELTATDNNGCTSKDTAVIFNYKANAGPDKVLCSNNAVLIGGLPLAGVAGIVYNWQPATGLSCTNCAQPLASSTGAYILTVTVSLPQGGTCITRDTVTVNSAAISQHPAGNDTTVCFGEAVTLGSSRIPGFTYNWTPGNFLNAMVDTAQPIFNRPQLTLDLLYNPAVYILTANNPAGCTIVDTVKIYVNYPYTGLGGCRPVQLGREDNSNRQATYQWLLSDGSPVPAGELSAADIPNPVALYNTAAPDRTYRLQRTWNGLTCSDTIKVFSNCICPPVQIKFKSASGCPSVTRDSLSMYVSNPLPGFVYTWSPSTGLNTNTGVSVKSGVRNRTHYTVTATSIFDTAFYCGSGDIWVNNPDTTAPEFTVRDTFVCKGQTVNIGLPEVTGLRYEWSTSVSSGVVVSALSDPAVTGDKDIVYYADVSDPVSGCHTYDTVSIRVPQVIADAGPSRSSCAGGGFRIGTASIPGNVYAWLPATGLDDAATAQPLITSNTATITYQLTVTEPVAGCTATDSITINHTDNPSLPPLTQPAAYCEGTNTVVQIGVPPLDSVTYSWSPATGLSDPTAAQPFANPVATTTYTLTAQFPGACASGASGTVTVTVKPAPGISISAVNNCGNTQLLASSAAVRPVYTWTPNTALTSTAVFNPVSTTTVPVIYTATVTDLTTRCSSSASYEVVPLVTANAGDDREICEGDIAAIGLPSATGATYLWSPATGLSSYNTAQTTTLNTLPAGTYTFYLTVTSNGCSTTDSVLVKVNRLPIITQSSSFTICRGAVVQIGTAGQPGIIYSWSPATGLSNPSIPNPIANPQQTTVYTLTVTNALTGCTASSAVTVVVSTQNAPVVSITKSCSKAICPGDSVRLIATVSGAGI